MWEGLFNADRWAAAFSNMGTFWDGFGVTLSVVVAGLALSLVLGTLLGVLSTTRSRVLRAVSRVYVEFYQNTPLPVQVLFMYMAGPQFLQAITGAAQPVRIAPFALGALGVGLYHAAYISEVIRTGIEAVPRGQMEAAQSQGFSRVQSYAYIVLPQTFKVILPPLCNQALNLVKNTSVLALVAGGDLMYRSDNFVSLYGYLQGYIICCFMYFIICFPLALLVQWLERRSKERPRAKDIPGVTNAGDADGAAMGRTAGGGVLPQGKAEQAGVPQDLPQADGAAVAGVHRAGHAQGSAVLLRGADGSPLAVVAAHRLGGTAALHYHVHRGRQRPGTAELPVRRHHLRRHAGHRRRGPAHLPAGLPPP